MRTIGVVTTSRSDYGIWRPILRAIAGDPELRLHLIVSGTHLAAEFGMTVEQIKTDGFEIGEEVEMLLASDSGEGVGKSMGLGAIGFSQSLARFRPDLLMVLGDRFEMHAAALAALPCRIPVAHVHGGEVTRGAIDDALRHSLTKLSHLHFVATPEYRRRVIQLGEEPWRVTVCGAPSLDNIREMPLLTRGELQARFGLRFPGDFLLVTYLPETLGSEDVGASVDALISALESRGLPVLFTGANADVGGRLIIRRTREAAAAHPGWEFIQNLGTQAYFTSMSMAAAMVGNSSSGIIEGASFELPVVNIGARQEGRIRGRNVIDVGDGVEEIDRGLREALDPTFRAGLSGMENPYGSGRAAEVILRELKSVPLDERLVGKRFHDLKWTDE